MATSTQQKQELFKAIWATAEDLRNSVDGWDFKSYVLGKENVKKGFFGQELNITTYNLCRINMFLHDINYAHFDIQNEDTLLHPAHWDDEPFDAIIKELEEHTSWIRTQ